MRSVLLVFVLFLSQTLSAQLNEEQIYIDTKVDTWESVAINSSQLPKVLKFDSLSIGPIDFDATAIGIDLYQLNYRTKANAVGDSKIIIEYYDQGNSPGLANIRFTTLHNLAKTSKVIAEPDYLVNSSVCLLYTSELPTICSV